MELLLTQTKDVPVLMAFSKRAFDTDILVGCAKVGGPPGYKSIKFYSKMARQNHLFTFFHDGLIVGGAFLFKDYEKLYIGRIFINPDQFHKGFGIQLMKKIESLYEDVTLFTLDTPLWNHRTNSFYLKLGYKEYKRDDEFAYYVKNR